MVEIRLFGQDDRVEADIFTDEVGELMGRDFTQTFEPGDFRFAAQFLNRRLFLYSLRFLCAWLLPGWSGWHFGFNFLHAAN